MTIYTIETNGKTLRAKGREHLVSLAGRLAPGTYEVTRAVRLGDRPAAGRCGSITIYRTGRVALRLA